MPVTVSIIIIIVALCLEAFMAMSELSIVSSNYLTQKARAEQGKLGSKMVVKLKTETEKLIGTTLFGTNLGTVTATTVCSLMLIQQYGEKGQAYTAAIMIPLVLLGAEVMPKSLAQARPNFYAPIMAIPLYGFYKIFSPIIFLLERVGKLVTKISGVRKAEYNLTPDELLLLLDVEGHRGEIKAGERKMIKRIFKFSDADVDEVMVPLIKVIGPEENDSYEKAMELFIESNISRLVVYDERIDKIKGFLYAFDILRAYPDKPEIKEIMRPADYYPENMPADKVLEDMQKGQKSIAVVVDEYGGSVGIVTIEDLVEEIVGEIDDEHDDPKFIIHKLGDDRFLLGGDTEIDEIEERFKIEFPEEESDEYETVAGFMVQNLEKMPEEGEKFLYDDWWFKVVEATPRNITLIEIYKNGAHTFPGEPPDTGDDIKNNGL